MSSFITTWRTTTIDESITLPLPSGFAYNFTVNYGDGSGDKNVSSFDDADATHIYSVADDYTVTIYGTIEAWSFNALGDKDKIIDVTQWGTSVAFLDLSNAFRDCSNLQVTATDSGNFGSVTDMSYMFAYCDIANPDVSLWDVRTVTRMDYMFYLCDIANPDVSLWDVSSVLTMNRMFYNCYIADPNVSNWDVSTVEDMGYIFYNCNNANPDVSLWDVGSVTDMLSMFHYCYAATPDVSLWNVSAVTRMDYMFYYCYDANPDISAWDISSVTSITAILSNTSWSTINYNKAMDAWALLELQLDVTFDSHFARIYSNNTSKASIISSYNWTITDNGIYYVEQYGTLMVPIVEKYFGSGSAFAAEIVSDRILNDIETDDVIFFFCHKDDDIGGNWFVSSSIGGAPDQGFVHKSTLGTTSGNDQSTGLVYKSITDVSAEPLNGTSWFVQTTDPDSLEVYIIVVKGANITSADNLFDNEPIKHHAADNTATPAITAGFTTNTDGCLLLFCHGSDDGGNEWILDAPTSSNPPTSYNILEQQAENIGLYSGVSAAAQITAGDVGLAQWNNNDISAENHVLFWAVRALSPAYINQTNFRARNDDDTEAAATWIAEENSNWTQSVDTNFRLRFAFENSGETRYNPNTATPSYTDFRIEYKVNAGIWGEIGASGTTVEAVVSSLNDYVINASPIISVRLTPGPYTFNTGCFSEINSSTGVFNRLGLPGLTESETEISLQIVSANVSDEDTIQIRLVGYDGTNTEVFDLYSNTPTITVNKGTGKTGTSQAILESVTGNSAGNYVPKAITGTGTATVSPAVGSATGNYQYKHTASADATLELVYAVAAGNYQYEHTGTAIGTLATITGNSSASYRYKHSATADGLLLAVTGNSSGNYTPKAIIGTADGLLSAVTGNSDGNYIPKAITGTADGLLSSVYGNGEGSLATSYSATADGVLSTVIGNSVGNYKYKHSAIVNGILELVTGNSVGAYKPKAITGTSDGLLSSVYGSSIGDYTPKVITGTADGLLSSVYGNGIGSSTVNVIATANGILEVVTGNSSGNYIPKAITGTVDGLLSAVTGNSSGNYTPKAITGTADGLLLSIYGNGIGTSTVNVTAVADGILELVTGTSSGNYTPKAITGTADGLLSVVTGTSSGNYTPKAITGTADGLLSSVYGNGIGSSTVNVVATADGTLELVTGNSIGNFIPKAITGTADGLLSSVYGNATGNYKYKYSATADGILEKVIGNSIGTITFSYSALANGILIPVIGNASGNYIPKDITGSGNGILANIFSNAIGDYTPKAITGTAAGLLSIVTGNAIGKYTSESISGIASGILSTIYGNSSGLYKYKHDSIAIALLEPVIGFALGTYIPKKITGTASGVLDPIFGNSVGISIQIKGVGAGTIAAVYGFAIYITYQFPDRPETIIRCKGKDSEEIIYDFSGIDKIIYPKNAETPIVYLQ